MRTPTLCVLTAALLAATLAPSNASAFSCDNLLPWRDTHCHGEAADTLVLSLHYHPNDNDELNDYVEVCFKHGDPTEGAIGDCRGALLPTLP